MDVYTKHRWLVYKLWNDDWHLVGPEHLSDWEATGWIELHGKSGYRYRVVEVYWYPQIELIEEVTKK
jgi:hypothetical protein